jgi:ABC-type spermidine/putrescine transport system permease subunit II
MNFKIPIFEYPSTNYFRAFLLYSIVGALIASIAVHVRLEINKNKFGFRKGLGKWLNETFGQKNMEKGSTLSLIISIILTFVITLLVYHMMFWIFGWGGGMLVNKKSVIKKSYF